VTFRLDTSAGPIDYPAWIPDAGGLIQVEQLHGAPQCSYIADRGNRI